MALKKNGLVTFRAGLESAIDRGVFNAAVAIEDLATQLAPVDTGALQASGQVRPNSPDGSMTYQVVFGGGDVDYAVYVEQGTDTNPAQPYLEPALNQINIKAEVQASIRALAQKSQV